MRFFVLLLALQLVQRLVEAYLPVDFNVNDVKDADNLRGLNFVSRFMLPYGPDLLSNPPQSGNDHPYKGYGYGVVSYVTW